MANQKAKRQRDHQARLAAIKARKKKEQDRKRIIVGVVTAVILILGVSVFVQGGGNDTTVVAAALASETLKVVGTVAGTESAATTLLVTRAFSFGCVLRGTC